MATVQLQRVLTAKTTTKVTIDEQQSLETVQTMLHGALSCVAYLRLFFPEKAFDGQLYRQGGNILPYSDYLEGDQILDGTKIPVLKRNRSKRVDTFLDWLEGGAYSVLKDGNLRALQVYVHPDHTQRDKIIETYTFTITYSGGLDGRRTPRGLEIAGNTQRSIAVDFTATPRKALLTMIRQIQDHCKEFPYLPAKRFVSMELFFLPIQSDDYQQNGWIAGNTDTKYFAQAMGWETRTDKFEELQSGFHSTKFEIRHLQDLSKHVHQFPNQTPPRRKFPKSFQWTECFSTIEFDQGQSTDRIFDADIRRPREQAPTAASTPSTVVDSNPVNGRPSNRQEGDGQHNLPATPGATSMSPEVADQLPADKTTEHPRASSQTLRAALVNVSQPGSSRRNTQSSGAYDMRMALQEMMQPENLSQGFTQSQACASYPRTTVDAYANTELEPNPVFGADIARSTIGRKPVLSQVVTGRLNEARKSLRVAALKRCNISGSKTYPKDVVLCQCGSNKDISGTVLCAFCGTWQHLACCGYLGREDSRMPELHVCYQCLLGGQEDKTLKKLCSLAKTRRGMHFVMAKGLQDGRKFAGDVGLGLMEAKLVESHLRSEGYLVQDSTSRSMRPHFVAVNNGPNYAKMLNSLFDPMLHISHLYGLPTDNGVSQAGVTQLASRSRAESMAPPITPALQLSKQNNAMTPASGLDLRASLSPFETPRRSSSRLAEKRRSDNDEGQLAAKRPRPASSSAIPLRSVQTAVILNADGLSSSPAIR